MAVKNLTIGTGTLGGGDTSDVLNMINQALPGFSDLSGKATGVVNEMLSGLPSPDMTRTSNAYFGVNSGMPGSEFVRNRGYDLYNQQAQQQKQTGLQNLLALLGGYGQQFAATPGQLMQNRLGYSELGQRGSEASANNELGWAQLIAKQNPDTAYKMNTQGQLQPTDYQLAGKPRLIF
jgi:hypothetical protein